MLANLFISCISGCSTGKCMFLLVLPYLIYTCFQSVPCYVCTCPERSQVAQEMLNYGTVIQFPYETNCFNYFELKLYIDCSLWLTDYSCFMSIFANCTKNNEKCLNELKIIGRHINQQNKIAKPDRYISNSKCDQYCRFAPNLSLFWLF